MLPLVLAVALNPINSSVIATALPAIAAGVRVPIASAAVLVGALCLTSAIAQPLMGRLGDIFPPTVGLPAGHAAGAGRGLASVLATTIAALVVSRVLIAAGTSAS